MMPGGDGAAGRPDPCWFGGCARRGTSSATGMKGPDLPGGEPTADTSSVGAPTMHCHTPVPRGHRVGRAGPPLPARPAARAAARGEDADALVLMLSELATNAVQHAATEFEVTVHVAPDGSRVRVEVERRRRGFPTPPDQVTDAPHGRGLHIVRALADAWGIDMRRDQPGKTVWFSSSLPTATRTGRRAAPYGSRSGDGPRNRRRRPARRPAPAPAPPPPFRRRAGAAGRPARLARPGGPGGARRAARRRRGHRRRRDHPLRQSCRRGAARAGRPAA